jgi:hypothetical protein
VEGWEPETPRRYALARPSTLKRAKSGLNVLVKSLR